MQVVKIKVENKIAALISPVDIICDNSDYVIEFSFDKEWDNYPNKTARFSYNGTYDEVLFEGNICNAPPISNAKGVFVGVFSGDIRTTSPALVPCKPSILTLGGTHADPPEDIYVQILDVLNHIQVEQGCPSDDMPLTDGEATPGESDKFARGDHVHPTDTSRASALEFEEAKLFIEANRERIDEESARLDTISDAVSKNTEDIAAETVRSMIAEAETKDIANGAKATAEAISGLVNTSLDIAKSALSVSLEIKKECEGYHEQVKAILAVDDETLNELQEVVDYIKSNRDIIDEITIKKVNVADIVDNLDSTDDNKPLSANMGRELKSLIDEEITRATEADNTIANTLETHILNYEQKALQGYTINERDVTLTRDTSSKIRIEEHGDSVTYPYGYTDLYRVGDALDKETLWEAIVRGEYSYDSMWDTSRREPLEKTITTEDLVSSEESGVHIPLSDNGSMYIVYDYETYSEISGIPFTANGIYLSAKYDGYSDHEYKWTYTTLEYWQEDKAKADGSYIDLTYNFEFNMLQAELATVLDELHNYAQSLISGGA